MSFDECRKIETECKRLLLPYVAERFKSTPRELPTDYDSQRKGDWIIRRQDGFDLEVELKAEVNYTGNVFLETLSNWHTNRYGWFLTSSAFQLWYVFLDLKRLYIMPLGLLRAWFWGSDTDAADGASERYRQVSQAKHKQHNLTQGYLVPLKDIMAEVADCETVHLEQSR